MIRMKYRKAKIVMQDGYEQYRITLPKEYCRKSNIVKGDSMLLLNNEDFPIFLIVIPEIFFNQMPYLKEKIENFLNTIGGETI